MERLDIEEGHQTSGLVGQGRGDEVCLTLFNYKICKIIVKRLDKPKIEYYIWGCIIDVAVNDKSFLILFVLSRINNIFVKPIEITATYRKIVYPIGFYHKKSYKDRVGCESDAVLLFVP